MLNILEDPDKLLKTPKSDKHFIACFEYIGPRLSEKNKIKSSIGQIYCTIWLVAEKDTNGSHFLPHFWLWI